MLFFSPDNELVRTGTLGALAVAAGGKIIHGLPDLPVGGCFTDTRKPVRGGLFIALRGENFDGNRFARQAVLTHGAAAVLVDRAEAADDLPDGTGAIVVANTRDGYLGIAAAHRRRLSSLRWFGITGSVGKSTTKEMLHHALTTGANLNVHKAFGSFNNSVGLPHTILGVSPGHQAAILELGTNHPGEIRPLAAVARPNIALITCAAESHLEAFRSIENVAIEKSEILSFQERGDTAVLNADSAFIDLWRKRARAEVITFGTAEADVRGRRVELDASGCARFLVRYRDEIVDCALRVPGLHQVGNALGVIAAAIAAGVRLNVAAHALGGFEGLARRFTVRKIGGVTLIDDAYNANPASFAAALETLRSMPAQRRFVVAGDMLELGENSTPLHEQLGAHLARCELSGLLTVGGAAALSGASAVKHGLPSGAWTPFDSAESAGAALKSLLRDGDLVLIKGSHGIHLEKCCEALERA